VIEATSEEGKVITLNCEPKSRLMLKLKKGKWMLKLKLIVKDVVVLDGECTLKRDRASEPEQVTWKPHSGFGGGDLSDDQGIPHDSTDDGYHPIDSSDDCNHPADPSDDFIHHPFPADLLPAPVITVDGTTVTITTGIADGVIYYVLARDTAPVQYTGPFEVDPSVTGAVAAFVLTADVKSAPAMVVINPELLPPPPDHRDRPVL
jgi:hypothetical protein